MKTNLPLQRCWAGALVLALVAGGSAPLAATLPTLLAPAPKVEVRRLHLDCPGLAERAPPGRSGPWLARCGLVH